MPITPLPDACWRVAGTDSLASCTRELSDFIPRTEGVRSGEGPRATCTASPAVMWSGRSHATHSTSHPKNWACSCAPGLSHSDGIQLRGTTSWWTHTASTPSAAMEPNEILPCSPDHLDCASRRSSAEARRTIRTASESGRTRHCRSGLNALRSRCLTVCVARRCASTPWPKYHRDHVVSTAPELSREIAGDVHNAPAGLTAKARASRVRSSVCIQSVVHARPRWNCGGRPSPLTTRPSLSPKAASSRSSICFPFLLCLDLWQHLTTDRTHVRGRLPRVLALVEDRAVDARPVSALRDLPHLAPDRRSTPRRDSRGVGCEARPLEITGARAIPPSRVANLRERPLGADAIRSLLHALELASVRGSACLHVRVPTSPGFVLSQITKRDRALACRSVARLSVRCW